MAVQNFKNREPKDASNQTQYHGSHALSVSLIHTFLSPSQHKLRPSF